MNGVNRENGNELVFSELQRVARAVRSPVADVQHVIDAIVEQATKTIGAASWAGLILIEKDQLVPQSTYGTPPQRLDELQQKLNEGPCIDAGRDQVVIAIDDMAADERWPGIKEKALELGVLSMLCVPLWVDGRRFGTLSMYAASAHAFSPSDHALTELYATLAALALADAQKMYNMNIALESRDNIGQAKGILMERFGTSSDAAFEMLTSASRNNNRKLIDVVNELLETGSFAGASPGQAGG